MIKFNHEESELLKAIGFESNKEALSTMLSALMAIEASEELSEKEELVLIHSVVMLYRVETKAVSMFDTISQEIEAVWIIKPKSIYEFISEMYTPEAVKNLTPAIEKQLASMV